MNIIRYKWPVIIAAGLHGALFVSFPTERPLRAPVVVEKTDLPPVPTVEVDLPQPVEDSEMGATSGGDPMLSLPDVPREPDLKIPFEMPPVSRVAPEKPVSDLKNYRGGPVGDIGATKFGAPPITLAAHLDRVPRAMAQPAPDYHHALRQDGVGGSVLVEFIVGTDGNVISADATRWSRRELVEPAVRAVLRWRFEPGTLHGRKVRFRMAVPIEFNAAG